MSLDVYVFASIGLLGFLFILLSFVLGEVGHLGDFGHVGDVGHVEVDHAGDVGGHEAGEAGHEAGPGWLSTRVIAIFLTAFGAVATAARLSGFSAVTSSALGFASGYGLGWCTWRILRFMYGQEGSSQIRSRDLEGQIAEVTVAIPAKGPGQVACVVQDRRTHQIARSSTGQEIPIGSPVHVVRVTPEGVLVQPVPEGQRKERVL